MLYALRQQKVNPFSVVSQSQIRSLMGQRQVRIADVARQAGVSATAVSFAFNNPDRLNAQTVSRILEVARQLGYTPNPYARALLTKSVGVIGVVVPQSIPTIFANPFFPTLYEGIGQVCEDNGLALLTVSPVDGSLAKAMAGAPVDGFIVVGLNEEHAELEMLVKRGLPFVIVDGDSSQASSVNVDDERGAWEAAHHLLQSGHRDILCLSFEADLTGYTQAHGEGFGVGNRRTRGYRRAFTEAGLAWGSAFSTTASVAAGEERFRTIWKTGRRPTAVLAVSDAIAIGVLQAARSLGIPVPGQLSVIGFDDIPMAALASPPLTTIRQPIVEKGETAAQLLLNSIAGPASTPSKIVLSTELVIRESTGPPGGARP